LSRHVARDAPIGGSIPRRDRQASSRRWELAPEASGDESISLR
jgi:hypothetical protein